MRRESHRFLIHRRSTDEDATADLAQHRGFHPARVAKNPLSAVFPNSNAGAYV
jgi:hypothetical protein